MRSNLGKYVPQMGIATHRSSHRIAHQARCLSSISIHLLGLCSHSDPSLWRPRASPYLAQAPTVKCPAGYIAWASSYTATRSCAWRILTVRTPADSNSTKYCLIRQYVGLRAYPFDLGGSHNNLIHTNSSTRSDSWCVDWCMRFP